MEQSETTASAGTASGAARPGGSPAVRLREMQLRCGKFEGSEPSRHPARRKPTCLMRIARPVGCRRVGRCPPRPAKKLADVCQHLVDNSNKLPYMLLAWMVHLPIVQPQFGELRTPKEDTMDKVQLVKSHRVSQSAETSKPNAGRTIGRYLVAMLIAVALVAAGAPTATAEEGLLSDNAGQSDQSDNANSSSEPDKDEPDPDSSTVTSPDPDRWPETRIGIGSALVTTTSGDMTVGLSMDDALMTERVTSTTGDTLLQDVLDGVNLAIKTQDTGFSIIAEIQSLSSPHEIGFDASIPTGAVLELLEEDNSFAQQCYRWNSLWQILHIEHPKVDSQVRL